MEETLNCIKKQAVSFAFTLALIFGLILMPSPSYGAATPTELSAANISITNNAGIRDVIRVTKLRSGDVIRVYNDGAGTDPAVASATVKYGYSYVTFEISDSVIDTAGGSVYLTVQSSGSEESTTRTQATYSAEPKSFDLNAATISVSNEDNSTGLKDKVLVTGLRLGDVIQIYKTNNPADLDVIGKSSPAPRGGRAEVTITDDLSDDLPLEVWVSVTNSGRAESDRVKAAYAATDSTAAGNVKVSAINNFGKNDYILITGLYSGDIVEATDDADGFFYGKATVPGRKTEVQITAKARKNLDDNALFGDGGKLSIKITTPGKKVQTIADIAYDAEGQSATGGAVTITNNAFSSDKVYVSGLYPGDKVEVHENVQDVDKNSLIKSVTVANRKNDVTFTCELPKINAGAAKGTVKIRIVATGMRPSEPFVVEYDMPDTSPNISTDPAVTGPKVVAVYNNASILDAINFENLLQGDQVYVFSEPTGDTVRLGNGKVGTGKTQLTVSLSFPRPTGTVYAELRRPNLNPSALRTAIEYGDVTQTTTSAITVAAVNYAGSKDSVIVKGVAKGGVIRIFATDTELTKPLPGGTATSRSADMETKLTPALPGENGGTVFMRITEKGQAISEPIPVTYGQENTTIPDAALTGTAVNLAGNSDYILFKGASPYTVIKLYETDTSTKVLASGTFRNAELKISTKLDPQAADIWYTATKPTLKESTRIQLNYDSEPVSDPFTSGSGVVIENNVNTGSMPDYIHVSRGAITTTTKGSVVRVYKGDTDTASIGSGAFNATGDLSIKLTSKNVLVASTGSIWLSHQEPRKNESLKYKFDYNGIETKTATSSAIAIDNPNAAKDYVLVYDLTPGSIVKLYYQSGTSQKVMTLTVGTDQTQVAFSVKLANSAWNTQINQDLEMHDHFTVTVPGKAESLPTYIADIKAN